jgi:starch synthase (maltosyl-transferring)
MSHVAELSQKQAPAPASAKTAPTPAEGPRIYDLFPPLIGPVGRWFDHLPRIAQMGFNWVLVGDPQQAPLAEDEALLKAFTEAARRQNLRVMTDLVAGAGPPSPAQGMRITDPEDYVHRCLGRGIEGFICRYAAYVPGETWAGLIAEARRLGETCFIADVLGSGPAGAAVLRGAGFDYVLNSTAWWDFRGDWLLDEQRQFSLVAPTLSFPEARETERLAAHATPELLEAWIKFRLLFAAVFSGGWMMPLGCEYGFRHRLDPLRTTPADWEEGRIDLSAFVAALNALRARCPALDIEMPIRRLSAPDGDHVALFRLAAGHVLAAERGYVLLLNPDRWRTVTVAGESLYGDTGGLLGDFSDITPDRAPKNLAPGQAVILEPLELRIFEGRRDLAVGRPRPRPVPALQGNRVVIENLSPEVSGGRHPAKAILGDLLEVEADVFTDGHGHVAAAVKYKADGASDWQEAPMALVENDRWRARIPLARLGRWRFTIEAWPDEFESWRSDVAKKLAAGQAIDLDLREGLALLRRILKPGAPADRVGKILAAAEAAAESDERARLLLSEELRSLMPEAADRRGLLRYPAELPVLVERLAARFSAWYELFPRSEPPPGKASAGFADVIGRLPYVRDLGFDVLYFPPIHPIGRTNRKGRNNSLTPGPADPGSPYAIGSAEGGHTAIEPGLGTLEDFRRLVAAAEAAGLEIALDFAIQCSPDHPWLREHPGWFDWRADGSLRYAENPPKKYEDIVNVDFDKGYPDLWLALRDVVLFWVGEGVRIFRVDNPHTKPVIFWEWMIAEIHDRHPDVVFLSEAFTRPKMMRKLAKVGFSQSYTYFTWRDTKQELTEYFTELCRGPSRDYFRPNLFTNTPDINPRRLQTGGRGAFMQRAALAATLSSAFGIYSGFELCESAPLPGREEYLDSEKYEIRRRDWDAPGNIRGYIAQLNRIRRDNPALHDFRNLIFYNVFDDQILLYGRMTPSLDNFLLVAVNLDPHGTHGAPFEMPLWEFKLPDHEALQVEDLFTGARWQWRGKLQNLVLDPAVNPAAIWRLSRIVP